MHRVGATVCRKGGIGMAQYQRFLSYLFEYEGDQKKENCGFAKVEIRGDVQRIFLSVKNKEQAEILHVFGFYRTNKGCDRLAEWL